MFKEILRIDPRLNPSDLNKMESSLTKRFGRIAKKFSAGLGKGLGGGFLLGVGMSIIDKIINPLKEVQDAIDRTLKGADDIVTNAEQFNTTSGRLIKLVALAKANGLDQDGLFVLMQKFQSAVAEAEADPKKLSAVRQFTGRDDTAAAFFDFIQSLKKIDDPKQQALIQGEVFGEKQILKMADFLRAPFKKQLLNLGAYDADTYTGKVDELGRLNDQSDLLEARRYLQDMYQKAGLIGMGNVMSKDARENLLLGQENDRIAKYKTYAKIQETSDRIFQTVEKILVALMKQNESQLGLFSNINKALGSRLLKGIIDAASK